MFKYLGVWILSDLSWTKHNEITCSKARRVLGYIYRMFALYCEPDTIISLHKSQVLPTQDYVSVVWESHLKENKQLELSSFMPPDVETKQCAIISKI